MSYAVSQNSGQDFRFSPLVWDMKAVEGSTAHRNLYELFRDHWNDGTISISKEGSYQYAFDNVKIRDLRGDDILVNLKYKYVVKADVRLGSVGAESARGFFDLNNNTFTSSENIVFEPLDIDKISEWPRITEDIPAPKQPLQLIGMFPLPNEPPQSSYQNPFTGEMLDPAKVEKGIYL